MDIVLTRTSLDALRHHISLAFPDIGKGHLCEDIAAGFGCRTYAALLAEVSSTPVITGFNHRVFEQSLFRRIPYEAHDADGLHDRFASNERVDAIVAAVSSSGTEVLHPRLRDLPVASPVVGVYVPDWRRMSPHARVVTLFHRLAEGMLEQCLRDYCADEIDRIPGLPRILAATMQVRRHLDPQVCDFMVEYLLDLDAYFSAGGQHGGYMADGDPSEWACNIMETYTGRIVRFLDAASMTWDAGLDPFSLPAPGPVPRRYGKVRVVSGLGRRLDEVGTEDTGSDIRDFPNLIGICEMARFLGRDTVLQQKTAPLSNGLRVEEPRQCLAYASTDAIGDYIAGIDADDWQPFNSAGYARHKAIPAHEEIFGVSKQHRYANDERVTVH